MDHKLNKKPRSWQWQPLNMIVLRLISLVGFFILCHFDSFQQFEKSGRKKMKEEHFFIFYNLCQLLLNIQFK